jgi:hypothetical protein
MLQANSFLRFNVGNEGIQRATANAMRKSIANPEKETQGRRVKTDSADAVGDIRKK